MFSIGEFSRITGLTIKSLRFYHEEQLLVPASIDPQTGYRRYDARQIETARAITFLRGLDISVRDIKAILQSSADEQVIDLLERQRAALNEKIRHMKSAARSLEQFISEESKAMAMSQSISFDVQEKTLPPMLIAGVRMKGRYSDCGRGFATIGRRLGRFICGKPLMLHYDQEYKEDDADFEACTPVRQSKDVDGVACRELPGGRCVSLVHKGPYDQLGRSYERILKYVKDHGYTVATPTREVYIKGPGMIFRGNPKNYLTEIEMLIDSPG
jgi:DNA-binding transcriptional MerR regulator/effector-binding domain-containing protein